MHEWIFVGRQRELGELGRYLKRSLAGNAQVCFITDQAGTGKTVLVCQFIQQGRTAEGRKLPAVCYGWFSEGLDTSDLRDARQLLDQSGGDNS